MAAASKAAEQQCLEGSTPSLSAPGPLGAAVRSAGVVAAFLSRKEEGRVRVPGGPLGGGVLVPRPRRGGPGIRVQVPGGSTIDGGQPDTVGRAAPLLRPLTGIRVRIPSLPLGPRW